MTSKESHMNKNSSLKMHSNACKLFCKFKLVQIRFILQWLSKMKLLTVYSRKLFDTKIITKKLKASLLLNAEIW